MMKEFTTTLMVRPVSEEDLNINDLVVTAGRLRRVMAITENTITISDEDGQLDTFPFGFFGSTWQTAVL